VNKQLICFSSEMFADFTFTETTRGDGRKTQILHDGFGYTYSSPLLAAGGALRWRCSKKSKERCSAFIIIRDNTIIRCQRSHNHYPNP